MLSPAVIVVVLHLDRDSDGYAFIFDERGNPEELYEQTASIAWEELISPDEYLCVVSRVDTPTITNTMLSGRYQAS